MEEDTIFPSIDDLDQSIVSWHTEDTEPSLDIDHRQIESWIRDTVQAEKKTLGALSIILCSDEYLLKVNREHLDHDYYTDIITFQYDKDPISGDLFISVERVNENAHERQLPPLDELHRVIIHGVLHLIGYGDKTPDEQKVMRSKEDHYLSILSSIEG